MRGALLRRSPDAASTPPPRAAELDALRLQLAATQAAQAERDRLEGERLRQRMRERRAGLAAAGGARGPSRSRG
ncbi:regulator of protease activity HflC (stomatin/prohibitin superfamily) [Sphaerotilus sulfidivorans]|uniref:Regulator of protease activity HflC (Stomatin/prohibitin superfamily) n=1 Tax=Sphaerotilus sulfidivorans TaxID=639200 RepID=A0A5C1Q1R9_9BURK|nr:hypothetical protein [Sphaerotilus sulfidivorans]NZD48095.1 hypothetical protein [Sphaerotilus sulfidivorans]QEN00836.1 hypothetical protein EWH46_08640 [Sphaerotilus sulfidivorans]